MSTTSPSITTPHSMPNKRECGLLAIGPSMSWPRTRVCHSLPPSCWPFTVPPSSLPLSRSAMGAFFVCRRGEVAVMWRSMGVGVVMVVCPWRVVKAVGGRVVSWGLLVKSRDRRSVFPATLPPLFHGHVTTALPQLCPTHGEVVRQSTVSFPPSRT